MIKGDVLIIRGASLELTHIYSRLTIMSSMERSSEARERAHVLKYIPRQFSSTSYIYGIHTRKLLIDSYMECMQYACIRYLLLANVCTRYVVHILLR